jgi:hypothetical protein
MNLSVMNSESVDYNIRVINYDTHLIMNMFSNHIKKFSFPSFQKICF